jgi:hypothetical protein
MVNCLALMHHMVTWPSTPTLVNDQQQLKKTPKVTTSQLPSLISRTAHATGAKLM